MAPSTKSLSEREVDDIVRLYDRGHGQTIADLAKAYEAKPAAVRYRLKQRGELEIQDRSEKQMSAEDTDESLGIGKEDAAPSGAADLAALLQNPLLKQLVDAAVAERMSQLAAPQLPNDSSAFSDLAASLKHMVEINHMQQPGYIKPLAVDEIDRRAQGAVDMWALLKQFEAEGRAPLYTVGENGFFECSEAQEFGDGEQLRTFLPPPVDFTPENDEAEAVHEAMMRWIGGENPDIGQRLRDAQLDAKLPPLVGGTPKANIGNSPVIRVQRAPEMSRPARPSRRTMGTVVPEPRGRSVPGAAPEAAPQGPTFV
jgi:hypothetical protein